MPHDWNDETAASRLWPLSMSEVRTLGARFDPKISTDTAVRFRRTPSGAWLFGCSEVVVKVHNPRIDAARLSDQLASAKLPQMRPWLLAPLTDRVMLSTGVAAPISIWPLVDVIDSTADAAPWSEAGSLLAGLHLTSPPVSLHEPGGPGRLQRAVHRLQAGVRGTIVTDRLARVGRRLLSEVAAAPEYRCLVHGDWHLGQMGRRTQTEGWRLIDLEDLGVGDPAWDLGKPAGFWAAGLLEDEAWGEFLAAYRAAGGPAVPRTGDPWSRLDLPARCAVFRAATGLVLHPEPEADGAAGLLLAACDRMTI